MWASRLWVPVPEALRVSRHWGVRRGWASATEGLWRTRPPSSDTTTGRALAEGPRVCSIAALAAPPEPSRISSEGKHMRANLPYRAGRLILGEALMIARHTRARLFSPPGHADKGQRLHEPSERQRPRRCRSAYRKPRRGSRTLEMRVARLITGMGLLSLVVSVCCSGCGIGKPPVMTLEQWEAQYNRVRSSE
jgi:hypothetical protein